MHICSMPVTVCHIFMKYYNSNNNMIVTGVLWIKGAISVSISIKSASSEITRTDTGGKLKNTLLQEILPNFFNRVINGLRSFRTTLLRLFITLLKKLGNILVASN